MTKSIKNLQHIIFTGGGSAGHVMPNIAIMEKFQEHGFGISYIGSKFGIEQQLITSRGFPYYAISSGKLRRYFSWKNFIDPFKVLWGILQATFWCRKIKPQVIFAKGGFVSLPVVIAAWLNRIPVFIHESDLTPGLANKLCFPLAKKIFVTFAATQNYFKDKSKIVVSGTPIRSELLHGDAEVGRNLCGFSGDKKIILVYGGSLGAATINTAIRGLLPELLKQFQLVHICGNNGMDQHYNNYSGYKQFEYLTEEFPHVLAAANLVISRSGANTIYELLALHKPHILIPLGKRASRGDQIDNAKYFAHLRMSRVIFEEALTAQKLLQEILALSADLAVVVEKLRQFNAPDTVEIIYSQILDNLT